MQRRKMTIRGMAWAQFYEDWMEKEGIPSQTIILVCFGDNKTKMEIVQNSESLIKVYRKLL